MHTVITPQPPSFDSLLERASELTGEPLQLGTTPVPSCPAVTREQLAAWNVVWPVTYIPLRAGSSADMQIKGWPQEKVDWIKSAVMQISPMVADAEKRGEVCLGIVCS